MLHRRGHVAESRRASEREPGAPFEIVEGRVGRAGGRDRIIDRFARRGNGGDGAHARLHPGHPLHAAGHAARHPRDVSMPAVVEDQDVGHRSRFLEPDPPLRHERPDVRHDVVERDVCALGIAPMPVFDGA